MALSCKVDEAVPGRWTRYSYHATEAQDEEGGAEELYPDSDSDSEDSICEPTWDGEWNELRSRGCPSRKAGPAMPEIVHPHVPAPSSVPMCGCGIASWHGKCREYCGKSCPGPGLRAPGDNSTFIYKLDPTSSEYQAIVQHFLQTWDRDGRLQTSIPTIKDIWDVTDDNLRRRLMSLADKSGRLRSLALGCAGTNLGNMQLRFDWIQMRCTFAGSPCSDSQCGPCGIINQGSQMKYAGKGHRSSSLFFGRGPCSCSASSLAVRYAETRATLRGGVCVALVARGRCEKLDGRDLTDCSLEVQDGPLSCCNAPVIYNPHDAQSYKNHIAMPGEHLLYCKDEIVVIQEDAILPTYLITFS
eukprot:TRINITY_DN3848_c0_g2_i1.p1 TRINITY_DN3848_c0_g2~~TRINITY_DN3848_c0_g2_i1.p1  ORF type:complete len:379 (+),score=48.82 TRINITY_DN3848_c0_g2_i1:69-1139(+)